MKTVEFEQGSPQWHTWRLSGLGGSDAPVIMDESPYKTRRQLYYEKKGVLSEEDEGSEFIFAKGHKVEALIRKEFFQQTGVEMKPVCVVHPKYQHLIASLDGYNSKLGVLEAKLVGAEVLDNASSKAEIPTHHFLQMQHQMAVSEIDRGQWFGHDGKKNGIVVPVKADPRIIGMLLDREHSFWEDLKANIIPPLTDRDYLVPDDLTLLYQLREAKELAANAEAHYEALREQAVNTFQHPKIAGAGVKIFRVTREGSIDWKSIPEVQALESDYLNKFRRAGSTSWSVIMDKKGFKKNG